MFNGVIAELDVLVRCAEQGLDDETADLTPAWQAGNFPAAAAGPGADGRRCGQRSAATGMGARMRVLPGPGRWLDTVIELG